MNMESYRLLQRARTRRYRKIGLAVAAVILLIGLSIAALLLTRDQSTSPKPRSIPAVPLPEALARPQSFQPLTVEQAIEANAKLPFTARSDVAAGKFVLNAASNTRSQAIDCLAQAVYYEAASEGEAGQRAVAQVVLNRMRHPAYPSSVCGVVYQGSERVMGCQFTFTCDGSLLRRPNVGMFATARRIAIEALAGRVFAPVGHATNYHADYVLPYWASSLDKQVQIGRHIFYRLKGGLGSSTAFGQRYAGREPSVVPQSTIILSAEALEQSDDVLSPEKPGPTNDGSQNPIIVADAVIKEPLAADARSGELIGDNGAGPPKKKKATSVDCVASGSTKILPTAPNALRSDTKVAC